jgi:hypothetical protein
MRYRHDPEGLRLPVKIDATSNGEFATHGPRTRREFMNLLAWSGA